MNKKDADKSEVAMILHQTEDHAVVIHGTEEHPVGVRCLTKHKEGDPLQGDIFTLKERPDGKYNMERTHIPAPMFSRSGPAQVASPAYRENFDKIFGKNGIN